MSTLFWIPTVSGLALTLIGFALPLLDLGITKSQARYIVIIGVSMLVVTWVIAKWQGVSQRRGGTGGTAHATGENSDAEGGAAGAGGGSGGNAIASGKCARAKGGAGS